jgi:hypothetical protein
MAMLVNGALMVRTAMQSTSGGLGGIAAVMLSLALAMFVVASWRRREIQRAALTHSAPPASLMRLVASAAVLASAATVWSCIR